MDNVKMSMDKLQRPSPSRLIGTRDKNNIKVIHKESYPNYGVDVEIIEYQKLLGNTNANVAQKLYFMDEMNLKCRQVAFYIHNNGVKVEAGAMSYFQGQLEMTTGLNSVGKAFKQAFTGKLTGEKIIMPEYKGSGTLVLEPSFKHFIVLELNQNESVICDKGMFFAASCSVDISPCLAGNASGTVLGGEGIFQQRITGPGVVVLESKVPMCEIDRLNLNNDVLKVDGNFAILRSGGIQMSVERSGKTLIGSAASGEGLVNVFRGTGVVWLAPTLKVYDALNLSGYTGGELSDIDFNTSTGRTKPK